MKLWGWFIAGAVALLALLPRRAAAKVVELPAPGPTLEEVQSLTIASTGAQVSPDWAQQIFAVAPAAAAPAAAAFDPAQTATGQTNCPGCFSTPVPPLPALPVAAPPADMAWRSYPDGWRLVPAPGFSVAQAKLQQAMADAWTAEYGGLPQ